MPDRNYFLSFIPVRVHINGETLTLAGAPLDQASREEAAEQIFACVLRVRPLPKLILVWRENHIGYAWTDDQGLRWVQGLTGDPVSVCCFPDGANSILKAYIKERLITIRIPEEGEPCDARR